MSLFILSRCSQLVDYTWRCGCKACSCRSVFFVPDTVSLSVLVNKADIRDSILLLAMVADPDTSVAAIGCGAIFRDLIIRSLAHDRHRRPSDCTDSDLVIRLLAHGRKRRPSRFHTSCSAVKPSQDTNAFHGLAALQGETHRSVIEGSFKLFWERYLLEETIFLHPDFVYPSP
jgi:hypothetical protein